MMEIFNGARDYWGHWTDAHTVIESARKPEVRSERNKPKKAAER